MDFSVLQPRTSSAYFPPHRTQLHPRMHSFPPTSSNHKKSHSKLLILVASLFAVPFLFYQFSAARSVHKSTKFAEPKSKFYGVAISAGLSGCRVRVFEFVNEGELPSVAFDGSGTRSMKVRPGVVEFGEEPQTASQSISELVAFSKRQVPRKEWASTRVISLVRGGLFERLSSDKEDQILESCRRVLRKSGFMFKDEWVQVVQGEDQGVYAWVAVNYALGSLGGEPQATTGVIELGGASLQVAFAQREATNLQSSRVIRLSGTVYRLYTQSLPQLGQDAAWESLSELLNRRVKSVSNSELNDGNPCLSRSYKQSMDAANGKRAVSYPAGNFSACKMETTSLLKARQGKCSGPTCENLQTSVLELKDNGISTESFLYTTEIFGMFSNAGLNELRAAGQQYCEGDWDTLRKQQHSSSADDFDLARYCFYSAYAVTVLHDGLGISLDNKRSSSANRSGIIPLDWTLGAYVVYTKLDSAEANYGEKIVGNNTVRLFALFAVLLIVALAVVMFLQWRKPQFKTIYDLEKGRYIVTRIPR